MLKLLKQLIIKRKSFPLLKVLTERTQNAVAHSNDVAEEVLSTMRTVRSFACENVEADR